MAYPSEILGYLVIRNTNHFQPTGLEYLRANPIFFYILVFKMLRAIQFNDQFCIMTVKINDIPINYFLAKETGGIIAKEVIPQMSFFLCHILAERFRICS